MVFCKFLSRKENAFTFHSTFSPRKKYFLIKRLIVIKKSLVFLTGVYLSSTLSSHQSPSFLVLPSLYFLSKFLFFLKKAVHLNILDRAFSAALCYPPSSFYWSLTIALLLLTLLLALVSCRVIKGNFPCANNFGECKAMKLR